MSNDFDSKIQAAVLNELKWDSRVRASEIGVTVRQGIVTLVGTVSSYAERLAAQEAAHRVQDVLDVANDLAVKVPGTGWPTDTEIALAVRHALVRDLFLPEEQILSTVYDGWVFLEGIIDRWSQRQEAEQAIAHLAGVRGVTSSLRVISPKVDPRLVEQAIRQALERRADREAERIWIEVHDGAVTLSGTVHSWKERQAVVGAAGHARGVESISDNLTIDPLA